jgi:hypothetical protein
MAIIQRANPVGIDRLISSHQNHLFNRVTISGFTNTDSWDSYDRAYGNPTEGGEMPEHFTGNIDYKEVLFDDRQLMTSFYWMGERQTVLETGLFQSEVSLIVQAQIGEIYPNDGQRYDESLRNQFYFNSQNYTRQDSFRLNGIETGIDNVYREFFRQNIRFTDMSKYHVFRLNYTVTYTPECCTNC